jgi:triacylglycerol esterase/lipase EstA (alpha/beta hydrolase family)
MARRYGDARVVLICHSMGGLVARHYLEVLGGYKDAKALITFGTPHRGSIDALAYLAGTSSCSGLHELMRSFVRLSIAADLPSSKGRRGRWWRAAERTSAHRPQ